MTKKYAGTHNTQSQKKGRNRVITKSDSYHGIIEVCDEPPKQQREIADGIINRDDEVVFFPITQLVSLPGVREATIVRFAQHPGHMGLPDVTRQPT